MSLSAAVLKETCIDNALSTGLEMPLHYYIVPAH
jgi:hypothetical protein